jgi:hypothetical protein
MVKLEMNSLNMREKGTDTGDAIPIQVAHEYQKEGSSMDSTILILSLFHVVAR